MAATKFKRNPKIEKEPQEEGPDRSPSADTCSTTKSNSDSIAKVKAK